MANADRTVIIPGRTPESAAMLANVERAMAITAKLNRLTFDDVDEVRALFSDLIGKKVDDSFLLIPPFYAHRRKPGEGHSFDCRLRARLCCVPQPWNRLAVLFRGA
jgi:hypothetical protein